jgi:ribosomal protein L14E/L6E/L27E
LPVIKKANGEAVPAANVRTQPTSEQPFLLLGAPEGSLIRQPTYTEGEIRTLLASRKPAEGKVVPISEVATLQSKSAAEIYATANDATGAALEDLKRFTPEELLQKATIQERLMRKAGQTERADRYQKVVNTLSLYDKTAKAIAEPLPFKPEIVPKPKPTGRAQVIIC